MRGVWYGLPPMIQPAHQLAHDVARFGTLTIEPSPARPLGPPDSERPRPRQDDTNAREKRAEQQARQRTKGKPAKA